MPPKYQVYLAYPVAVSAPGGVIEGLLSWLFPGAGAAAPVAAPPASGLGPFPTAPPAEPPSTGQRQPARQNAATIQAVASRHGIDPDLGLATAIQESGLNNVAVGDQGTSFGLFQLHRGGELGNLSPEQAFDPNTNAEVALSTMAEFASRRQYDTPGQLAAAAQRPADPAGYASAVDAIYNRLKTDARYRRSVVG